MDYNPFLKPARSAEAAKGSIESLDNMVWQTRAAPPTEFENALCALLERIFESGATELPEIVAQLKQSALRPPHGGEWTEDAFLAAVRESR